MTEVSKITPVLQTYSILAAALTAGTNLATTIVTLPVLLPSSPSTLATQWLDLYNAGLPPVATLAVSSAAGFAVLAYNTPPSVFPDGSVSNVKRYLYIGAAIGAIAPGWYTQTIMRGLNLELMGIAGAGGKTEKDVHALVGRWGVLNFWRGCCVLVGAGLGVWASLDG